MPTESQALKSPITTAIVAYTELDNDMVWVCPENPLPVRVFQETDLATEQTLQSVDLSLNYIETNTGDLLIKVDTANSYLSALDSKLPPLSSGRVPVEVGSLNVTLDNAQIEIANDSGNPIPVTILNAGLEISNDSGNPIPVTGTITANTGLSQPLTDSQLRASNVNVALGVSLPAGYNTIGYVANTSFGASQNGLWSVGRTWTLSSSTDSVTTVPSGTQTVSGTVTANAGSGTFAVSGTFWQNTQPVSFTRLSSGTDSVTTSPISSTSGTLSSVSGSVTQVTILAANSSRKGGTVYNDNTASTLKLACNSTVTSTSFTVALQPKDYWEIPYNYTGIITGIFSIAAGAARVTEFT